MVNIYLTCLHVDVYVTLSYVTQITQPCSITHITQPLLDKTLPEEESGTTFLRGKRQMDETQTVSLIGRHQ